MSNNSPKVFVAPSGMMTAGYSVYIGQELLPHSNNAIIFCGYSSEGSLARKIKDKKTKTITIDGKSIHSRCQVTVLKTFSSHALAISLSKIGFGSVSGVLSALSTVISLNLSNLVSKSFELF